jgi:hypothetical protein
MKLSRDTAEGRQKASQYIAAAESLANIDPSEAERLMRKAADIDGPALTPVESEYLTYAQAHPRATA